MKKQTKSYRYTLERCTGNRKKSICPNCGHRTFVRYIDVETGKPLGEDIGRCDREINCGYHKKPRDYFFETRPLRQSLVACSITIISVKLLLYMMQHLDHEVQCFLVLFYTPCVPSSFTAFNIMLEVVDFYCNRV